MCDYVSGGVVKRGAPLPRKKPMNRGKPKKAIHDYVVDNGFVSASTLQPLPKLPPLPKRKPSRPKTTKARQAAKGRECTIRVPGVCERTNETVVLCHYRLAGTNGMGEKPHDSQAAFGCHACHDAVDGRRTSVYSKTELRLMHAEGVLRTQAIIRAEAAR